MINTDDLEELYERSIQLVNLIENDLDGMPEKYEVLREQLNNKEQELGEAKSNLEKIKGIVEVLK